MEPVIILINIVVVRIVYTNYPRFSFATPDYGTDYGGGVERPALQQQNAPSCFHYFNLYSIETNIFAFDVNRS